MRDNLVKRRIKTEEMGDLRLSKWCSSRRSASRRSNAARRPRPRASFSPVTSSSNMWLLDQTISKLVDRTWYFMQAIRNGVIGFAGTEGSPGPHARPPEVESLLAQVREREDRFAAQDFSFEVWRDREGRRWAFPKPERRGGRDRSRAGQTPRLSLHFRPQYAGRPRILAGRAYVASPSFFRYSVPFPLRFFMAKEVVAQIKLQIPAGAANPAPPVGPALGQQGVNIMGVLQGVQRARPRSRPGDILPVVITVFKDKSFYLHHEVSRPSSVLLIKKAAQHRFRLQRAEQDQGGQADAQKQLIRDRRSKSR